MECKPFASTHGVSALPDVRDDEAVAPRSNIESIQHLVQQRRVSKRMVKECENVPRRVLKCRGIRTRNVSPFYTTLAKILLRSSAQSSRIFDSDQTLEAESRRNDERPAFTASDIDEAEFLR